MVINIDAVNELRKITKERIKEMTTSASPATEEKESLLENKVKEALRRTLMERQEEAKPKTAAIDTVEKQAEEVKKKEIVLGKNQVKFSKLVGKKLDKKLIDFAVTTLDVATLPSEVKAFVPVFDPGYNLQVEEAHAVLMAWEAGDKTLITGPTGSGKSTLIAQCCALTGRPMLRVNMTGDIESAVLFGSLVIEGGATVWKDGPVTEAARYGAVCCIDEWDVTPPEILFGMQWLFEENGKLFLKEKPGDSNEKFIVPHKDFRLVCLGNTVGQGDDTGRYSGVNVQNNASIDRFQTTVLLDYLAPQHEIKIIEDNCKGVDHTLAEKMVSFAGLVRTANKQNNINLTMSPRTLVNWGRKFITFADLSLALKYSFVNKLRDSDRVLVEELYKKVFGKSL